MHVSWAIECLEQGVRLPEQGQTLPGGAPMLLGAHDSPTKEICEPSIPAAKIRNILERETRLGISVAGTLDLLVTKVSH